MSRAKDTPGVLKVLEEVGAEFDPYRGGPPIVWRDASGLAPLYASLLKLRHDTPVLRSGSIRLLSSDHDDTVLAYEREPLVEHMRSGTHVSTDAARAGSGSDDDAVVVINFGGKSLQIHTRLDPSDASSSATEDCLATVLRGRAWLVLDLLSQAHFELASGAPTLPLSAHDAVLLRPSTSRDPTSTQ